MAPAGRRTWRPGALGAACALLAALALLAQPSPPRARANVPCDVGTGPIGAVSGAVGLGNPVGDVCDKVSGAVEAAAGGTVGKLTSPVTGALNGIGDDVFRQLTSWVAEGASWLMGRVVTAIDRSTTPQLDTEGFLAEYGRMAALATVLAAAMLLFAVLEGIAQGNPGLLVRVVLVNVPLAFLGTTVAYAIVQLLLTVTDQLSAAVAAASHHNSQHFFEAAIGDLGQVGGNVGKAVGEGAGGEALSEGIGGQAEGTVAVPLFVGFLAAIVGAFAAFCVWLELLMRDAAVYAVSLFLPLSLAASIWPRWSGVMRRCGELLVAVIGSKFVIVAIVSLAAALVAEGSGSVEHILAAAALMSLACFAPFVLLRLIPFSEGALAAAYGRRSAAGGAISAVQIGSDVQMIRNMGRSHEGSGVTLWGAGGGGGGGGAHGTGGGPGSGGGGGGAGEGGAAGASAGAEGAAGGPAAVAAVPGAVAKGAKEAGQRLGQTGVAQDAAGGGGQGSEAGGGSSSQPQRPGPQSAGEADTGGGSSSSSPQPPRPQSAGEADTGGADGSAAPPAPERPPRPAPEGPEGPEGPEPESGGEPPEGDGR